MGDKVSFLDSLLVTVFSMVVVFIVLIVIAYLIDLLKVISNRDKNSKHAPIKEKEDKTDTTKNQETTSAEDISEELVAVLTASIAAKEGIEADKIKIKSIRKLNNNLKLEDNPEELVAVIAAAVAANLGLNIPDINIKSIRRVPQNINTWADMGRREQLQ